MKSLQYINSIIASKKDMGLLVFRILIGIAFIWHGVPKLLSGPEGWTALGSMMGAFGIHLFPTFFGLFYRPIALFLVGNLMMATSIELASSAPLLQASRPFEEGVFFLGVVFAGPGRYSFDYLLHNEVQEDESGML